MKLPLPEHAMPQHGSQAQETPPVICYPVGGLAGTRSGLSQGGAGGVGQGEFGRGAGARGAVF